MSAPQRKRPRRHKRRTPACDNYKQTTFTPFRVSRGKLWRFNIHNVFSMSQEFDPDFLRPNRNPSPVSVQEESDAEQYDPSQALGKEIELEAGLTQDVEECPQQNYVPTPKTVLSEKRKKEIIPADPVQEKEGTIKRRRRNNPGTTRQTAKQATPAVMVTLFQLIRVYMPMIDVSKWDYVCRSINSLILETGPNHPSFQELQPITENSPTWTSILGILTDLCSFWEKCRSKPSNQQKSLQACLMDTEIDTSSTQHIGLPAARTLGRYFRSLLTEEEQHQFRSNTEIKRSSRQASTTNPAGSTYTFSTVAHGTTTHADAASCSQSKVFGSQQSDTLTRSDSFLPRTSGALRSITWQMASHNYTAKWERNSGEYLVKMEVYRWQEIRHLPSKDWWRLAIHRSQVFGNEADDHVQLAAKRAEAVKELVVDPKTLTPKHQDVATFSEQRPQPRPPSHAPGYGQWQSGSGW